jgi:hypothetical protein
MKHACCLLVCLVAGLLLLASLPAQAGPYVSQGPFVVPQLGSKVPGPPNVPGKEYSDDLDKSGQVGGPPDPEQVIAWDGASGVRDSFDYTWSRLAFNDDEDRQVDALANKQDILFNAVINNGSALLFSVDDESRSAGAVPPFSSPYIFYEPIGGPPPVAPPPPGGPIWAKPLVEIDQHGVTDVDALEVWGPEPQEGPAGNGGGILGDADRYSLYGDPFVPALAQRISVWAYNAAANASTPYITAQQIANAIGEPDLQTIIDLDAMMISDLLGDDEFGTGDTIMFSIAPVAQFDGGEIWVWRNPGPAVFLNHGGHLWNTAFNVMGSFGVDSENINALESVAVPEPGTLISLGLGGLALAGWVLLRRRKV